MDFLSPNGSGKESSPCGKPVYIGQEAILDEKWCDSVEKRLGTINEELGEVMKDTAWLKGKMEILLWIFGGTTLLIIGNLLLTLTR